MLDFSDEDRIKIAWDGSRTPREDHGEMAAAIAPVVRVTGFSVDDIRGRGRDFPTSNARQLAMWHLHGKGYSIKAIGRFLGGRDHTTVLHGIRRVNARMEGVSI